MEMKFFKQDQDGQYVEAVKSDLDEYFRENSDRIVSEKLAKRKDKYMEEVREKAESMLRDEITKELTAKIEKEQYDKFQSELDALKGSLNKSETSLRRKTVAAEYGFKSEAEEFLGTGTIEEMRAKADKLKDTFMVNSPTPPIEKNTSENDNTSFIKLEKISDE